MEKEVKEEIEKVDRAMSQEGMPLTEEEKKKIEDVITSKVSGDQVVKEIIKEASNSNEGVKKR